jgi:predicted O-methyltransferase YrrM
MIMTRFLKRTINRIVFERLKLQLNSFGKFKKKFSNFPTNINSASRFTEQHRHYVSAISRSDMAISLELSNFMYSLCVLGNAKKILDMGSGFSSYVLRTYAGEKSGSTVWSVDDDTEWLDRTREYLAGFRINTDNLLPLDKFLQTEERDFDFILLDLNYVEVRKEYIGVVIERCAPGGIIVFDDVHKREYMAEVLRQTSGRELALYSLTDLT